MIAAAVTSRRGRAVSWRMLRSIGSASFLLGMVLIAPLAGGEDDNASAAPQTVVNVAGISEILALAYAQAPQTVLTLVPDCKIRWQVLAGVGKVESGHATFGGAVIQPDGTVAPPIFGPVLDGHLANTQVIRDTDDGALDGNTEYDRAVGPAQFIPPTWASLGVDGNADGRADPQNVYDSELSKARYLCQAAPGHDLTTDENILDALWAYNHSHRYGADVLQWIHTYDQLSLTEPIAGAPGEVVAGYALPLPRSVFDANPRQLTDPHHDYPASDLMVPEGTPVYAVRAGRVARVTDFPHNWWSAGCSGNNPPANCATCGVGLSIDGDDGARYTYCHGTDRLVEDGDQVTAGQQILVSGDTGRSGAPHLHFEIRTNGTQRCPQQLLQAVYNGGGVDPFGLPTSGCFFLS